MPDNLVTLITGTRKGIGRYLAEYYLEQQHQVIGCSRSPAEINHANYQHFCLDVSDETSVKELLQKIKKQYGRLDHLINNAGTANMNHSLLMPLAAVNKIMNTNVIGTFLFCREAAKLMLKHKFGRIVNFTTVASPLALEGEAIYAASKSSVLSLTRTLARELASFGITVNCIGPNPLETDLIKSISTEKIQRLLERQVIPRYGKFQDISNVIDFYLRKESDFITGQNIYLAGIS